MCNNELVVDKASWSLKQTVNKKLLLSQKADLNQSGSDMGC